MEGRLFKYAGPALHMGFMSQHQHLELAIEDNRDYREGYSATLLTWSDVSPPVGSHPHMLSCSLNPL